MGRLKVEPEVGLCAEVAGQLGGGIRSDGTALVDNISYAVAGTPRAMASAWGVMYMGFKNSFSRISPGCVRTRIWVPDLRRAGWTN